MKKLRTTLIASGIGAVGVAAALILAPTASAHGWVTDPPSRQDYCASGATSFDCGSIKYEPQSVEAPKGSMQCSGGNAAYSILDDESKPWPRKKVSSTTTIQWHLSAAHATSTWDYFVDGKLFATFDQGGKQPPSDISHTLSGLPAGNHTILARWNVADTVNAFYNCIDITVGEGGTTTPTPDPTDPTPDPTDPGTTTGTWSSSTVYLAGDQVTYDGKTYKAKWWTQGETPGTAAVWAVVGGSDGGTTPNPTPTTPATGDAWDAAKAYTSGAVVSYDGKSYKAKWWTQGDTPGAAQWGPWELQG